MPLKIIFNMSSTDLTYREKYYREINKIETIRQLIETICVIIINNYILCS